MSELSPQDEESKEDAARALFNPSHVMLHALSHSLTPHTVRTRLLQHVAGVPPDPRPKSPIDPYKSLNSQTSATNHSSSTATIPNPPLTATTPAPLGPPAPMVTPPHITSNPVTALGDTPDPIVAYVRRPLRPRRQRN